MVLSIKNDFLNKKMTQQQSRSENMEWSLFKILAKKILHLDPNTLIDYCDIEIDNEDLKIKQTYDIQPPNLEPRPKNLVSEWPPDDKMYFFHDYFKTQLSFVNPGDHIATFKPEHHSIVVMLSRIAILLNWCHQGCNTSEEEEEFDKFHGVRLYLTELQTFFEKMSNRRCKKIPKSQLQSPMYNTTLKEIESFINDESGVIEYGKRLQVQNDKKALQTKQKKLEMLLQKKIENKIQQYQLFVQKYEDDIKTLQTQHEQIKTQLLALEQLE